MVVVRLAKVMPPADMSGVITANIVWAQSVLERVDERLADTVLDRVDVIRVEEDDKHARARILRRLTAGLDAVRLGPHVLRHVAANDDVLELFDLLGRAGFDDFEVVLRQIADRRAVFRRKHVDADVVRFGAERRARGLTFERSQ